MQVRRGPGDGYGAGGATVCGVAAGWIWWGPNAGAADGEFGVTKQDQGVGMRGESRVGLHFPVDRLPYGAQFHAPMTRDQYDAIASGNHALRGALTEVDGQQVTFKWHEGIHAGGLAGPPRDLGDIACGTIIDRFGLDDGTIFYEAATPFPARALPPYFARARYSMFERTEIPLPEGWRVRRGMTAPDHGQPGGGIQFSVCRYSATEGGAVGISMTTLAREGYFRALSDAEMSRYVEVLTRRRGLRRFGGGRKHGR